jgi:hypothetical protein
MAPPFYFSTTGQKSALQEESDYSLAMEQYLMMQPVILKQVGDDYPEREELHER